MPIYNAQILAIDAAETRRYAGLRSGTALGLGRRGIDSGICIGGEGGRSDGVEAVRLAKNLLGA